MATLKDLWNKFTPIIKQKTQQAENYFGIGNQGQGGFRQEISQIPQNIRQNITQPTNNYLNNVASGQREILPNIGYRTNFKNAPVENIGRSIYGFANDIGSNVIGQGILAPVKDVGQNIDNLVAGKPITPYNQLNSGVAKLGYDISGQGSHSFQGVAADLGKTVMPIINAWGGGKAKSAFEAESMAKAVRGLYGPTAQKAALKVVAKEGAITGGKIGASFGASSAAEQGRNMTLPQDIKNIATGTATGSIGGIVLGGITPYAGQGARELGYQVGQGAKALNGYVSGQLENPTMAKGFADFKAPLSNEAKTYKTTINLQNKDDANYLSRVLGEDRVKQLQSGDYTHFRNPGNSLKYWEDTAKVNIVNETPKTVAENLVGKVKDYKLNSDTVFHGTAQDNVNPILSGGFKSGADLPENAFRGGGHGAVDQKAISFSTDEKQASVFGGVSQKGSVLEAKLKPNAKVVTVKGVDYAEDLNDMIPELRKQGIDAVYLEGEKEVAVINKNAVKPTGKYQNFNAIDKYNPTLSQPLSTTPKTMTSDIDRVMAAYRQSPNGVDLNAVRAEFKNNPKALKTIDKVQAEVKIERAKQAVITKRENEYGNKLNALANNYQAMSPDGTLNIQGMRDFQKAEYELAKQYPEMSVNADKIAYYEKTHGISSPKTLPNPVETTTGAISKETAGIVPKETVASKPQISLTPQPSQVKNQSVSFDSKVAPTTPFYNSKNLNISSESKKLVDKTVSEIVPQIEKTVGKKLTNQEVIDLANNTSKTLTKTIGVDQTAALGAQQLKVRQQLANIAKDGKVTPEFIDLLQKDKAFAENTARLLQQRNIVADPNSNQLQAILQNVLKQNKNTDEILNAAKGIDFNDPKQATEFYRTFVKPRASEWLDTLRYNSMLSSPNTHINNAFSNTIQASIVKPLEKTITGGLDFLGSLGGKERKAFAGEGLAYAKGYWSSLGDATHKFADVMRGKSLSQNLDTKYMPLATKGIAGKTFNALSYPMKMLEASDQFFTTLGKGGETAALNLKASNGIKVGNVETTALENATKTLFRQDLNPEGQGHILGAIDKVTGTLQNLRNSENPVVSNIAKFTIPFIKTPMNIFKQGIEYSPAGVSTMWGAGNKTEQLSKAIIGSSVFAGAATLLGAGRLTWGEPTSEKQKNAYRSAGMQPYSVKIGDKWVAYSKLGPLAFPIAMVAAIDDAEKNKKLDESTTEQILSGIAKYGNFLADQSYAKNIGDLISAAKNGESGISYLVGNYPQQLVPYRALSGWIARLTDPTQRKVDPQGTFIDKQVQQLMMNIPGLTDKVPARTDQFGQPIQTSNPTLNAFSPLKVTTENTDNKQLYNDIISKSMLTKEKTQTADAIKSGNTKNIQGGKISDNMWQLSDGSIMAKIGDETSTFKTKELADKAITKDTFEKSGKSVQVIGDTVWRLGKDGNATSTPKISYDASLMEGQKTSLKSKGDVKGWLDNADKLYQNYQTQLQDPTLDDVEKLTIQNKMDSLLTEAQKYQSYGGFTKAKKAVYKPIKFESISNSTPKFSYKVSAPKKYAIKGRLVSKPKLT